MSTPSTEECTRELTRLLQKLAELQDQLTELVKAKTDAMARADMAAMRTIREKELAIADEIQRDEAVQCRLMNGLEMEVGVTNGGARSLTVAAESLRRLVARLARLDRDLGSANRLILNHLKWVFPSVGRTRGTPASLSGDGVLLGPLVSQMFEAAA